VSRRPYPLYVLAIFFGFSAVFVGRSDNGLAWALACASWACALPAAGIDLALYLRERKARS